MYGTSFRTKVISMAKPQPSKEERRILRVGKPLSSDEVEQLNEMENIVQLSTWLDSRVRAPNREARRKILYAFRKGCKEARLEQADEEGNLVPLMWNQGGHRIIYTLADEDLLLDVLRKLRPRFETTMRWYSTMANQAKKKKQATLHKYLKRSCSNGSTSSDSGGGCAEAPTPSTGCDACADTDEDALSPTEA